ncbi:VOC family protein [Phenylobacterium terrae]|uniref:VOC family protein n=1 Tax=Phenylobacterium terrae TaxID=2665495 RepID=A0ABW4N5C5_9CAUL
MTNTPGEFIWYELMTSDPDAAADFYGAVVGWTTKAFEGGVDYRLFGAPDADVAGLMRLEQAGAPAGWFGYIGVEDVDAKAREIVAAGGTQHAPPTDIPGVGRFAMLADPQGVAFYIMRGASEEPSTSFKPNTVGHCQWNELNTTDPAAALAFYTRAFGWLKGDVMPMGEMGDYQFINIGEQMIGAMMGQPPGSPPPNWLFYFGVDDIDRAAKAVTDRGGQIHHGPAEVPGGDHIIVATDPQGAMVGFVGPKRS